MLPERSQFFLQSSCLFQASSVSLNFLKEHIQKLFLDEYISVLTESNPLIPLLPKMGNLRRSNSFEEDRLGSREQVKFWKSRRVHDTRNCSKVR